MLKVKQFKRIYVEITNICNLECAFCPKTKRKMQSMDISSFEKILKKITPYTDYIYLHVKGEPLIHPQISKILDLCNQYQLKVNLTTNGTLLYKNKEMLISKSALRQINISLHGLSEQYMDEVLEAVREINEKTNVYISLRLWNQLDKKRVTLSERIFIDEDKEFEWPSMDKPVISTHGKCHALTQQIAILVDGTIVPCCLDNNGDINLGNIFEQDFEDMMKSERFNKIRDGFRNRSLYEELCKRCEFIQQKFSK